MTRSDVSQLVTARDKLVAAAGLVDHMLAGDCGDVDAVDAIDRLLDAVRGHLHPTEERHGHGG